MHGSIPVLIGGGESLWVLDASTRRSPGAVRGVEVKILKIDDDRR